MVLIVFLRLLPLGGLCGTCVAMDIGKVFTDIVIGDALLCTRTTLSGFGLIALVRTQLLVEIAQQ